jgi:hypothetical protein
MFSMWELLVCYNSYLYIYEVGVESGVLTCVLTLIVPRRFLFISIKQKIKGLSYSLYLLEGLISTKYVSL